jgi:hypothetical protein
MMMKKISLFLAAVLFSALVAQAGDRVVERTYLSTDKEVYVAGDALWYSAFCVDAAKGTPSSVSDIAYVELHGNGMLAATGKVALMNGRGAGRLELPASLPTGNYRLVAYTAQNKAESGYDYTGLASKTVSVFNVFSTERVKDGVEVVSESDYAATGSPVRPGLPAGVEVAWSDGAVKVVNKTGKAVSLSVSVYHDDGILSPDNPTIADFVAACTQVGPRTLDSGVVPEYEGEIIRGRITGLDAEAVHALSGHYAFLSTPSDKSDVYASPIDENGRLAFYTGNLYGDKECICEVEGIDPSLNCFIELESPFVNARVADAAPLRMTASLQDALQDRSFGMQVARRFLADTLYEFLPVRDNGLFEADDIVYPLDDYTRFTTMEEVFVEFIQEIRARRRSDGSRDIQVLLANGTQTRFSQDRSLMLLDGVPVFDHQKIMDYDPLLVEAIHIYPRTHYIGTRVYDGIANFVTYKHNLPAFKFGGNTRVIDWQGVSWPMAMTGAALRERADIPDYRQTICWHPLLNVAPGAEVAVPCKQPDYKGRFIVVVEGLSADGTPVRAASAFELR